MTWCQSVLSIQHQPRPSTTAPPLVPSASWKMEPVSCNWLATKKLKQIKLLISGQFDLDTMNIPQKKELVSLVNEMTDIFYWAKQTLNGQVLCSTAFLQKTTLLLSRHQGEYHCTCRGRYANMYMTCCSTG